MTDEQERKTYLSTFFSFCLCSDLFLPSPLPLLPFSNTLRQTLIPSLLKLSVLHDSICSILYHLLSSTLTFFSPFPKFDSRRLGMT